MNRICSAQDVYKREQINFAQISGKISLSLFTHILEPVYSTSLTLIARPVSRMRILWIPIQFLVISTSGSIAE